MQNYIDFGIKLAKDSGNMIRDYFAKNLTADWKVDETPVTEVDQIINNNVVARITQTYPEHNLIAEEGSIPKQNSEYCWVCDPLDGTLGFVGGLPTCVFSLALVHNGSPILGIIYDPFLERMTVAEKGKGCFINNRQYYTSKLTTIKNSLVGLTIYDTSVYQSLALIKEFKDNKAFIINCTSTAYMSMLVAAGKFTGTIYLDKHAHDVAAVKVIVEEAGGRVTDLFGNEQRYDQPVQGCLISNGALHEPYLQLIQKAGIKPL